MNINQKLKNKSLIGEWVTFSHKNDKNYRYRGICVDEVVGISNDCAHRLQKIIWCQHKWCQKKKNKRSKWIDDKKTELESSIRFCYWVISKKKKIVFGQYSVTTSPKVVGEIFEKAHKKGFFKEMTQNQMLRKLNKSPKYANRS